jgi:hypothetical protein
MPPGGTVPEQVFMIPYDQREPEIGMGFNTRTGEFVGTAITFQDMTASAVNPGQHGGGTALIINTHDELVDRIDAGASASARYGTASGSLKLQFSSETQYNSTSTFILATSVVDNTLTRGHVPSVPDSSPARELLAANRVDDFHRAFGDAFVRGIKTGGQYYAVIRITSVDTSTQSSLATKLSGEINGMVAGGSFQASYNQAQASKSSYSEVSVAYYQASGLGVTAGATLDVASVIARLQTFATIAHDSPVGVEVEIATYDTVPIPVPTLEEIQNLQIALDDAHAKRLSYLTTKNDFEFALANDMFFDGLPAPTVMRNIIGAYTEALNKVMAHAAALAKGKLNPAALFDPTPLNLPSVPELTRRQTPTEKPSITLPDYSRYVAYTDQGGNPMAGYLRGVTGVVAAAGLRYTVRNMSGVPQDAVDGGDCYVTGQSPPPGTSVVAGSTVLLQV